MSSILNLVRAVQQEDGGDVELSFKLSTPSSTFVSARFALVDDQAEVLSGDVVFSPGQTEQVLTLPVPDLAAGMAWQVELSQVQGATLAQPWAVVVPAGGVVPAAVANPLISVADVTVGESQGYVDLVIKLSDAGTQTVTVDYVTSQYGYAYNTADDFYDFTDVAGTLTFAPGETSKTVRVTVANDTAIENMESFYFQLSNASGGSIYDGRADITIVDNDVLKSTPQVYVGDVVVNESAGTATFMVTLGESGGQRSASTVTVDFSTANGTATAGSDYTATNGTLSFAAGESVKFVTVNLNNDNAAEGAESFFVNLGNASGASIVDGQAVGTIALSDGTAVASPRISVGDVIADETAGYVDVIVTLSAPGTELVTVDYVTNQNGLPYNGADDYYDFGDVAGTLSFAVGETVKSVRVYLVEDATAENPESFFFQLSNASGAAIYDGRADITIVDNDTLKTTPQVYVGDVVVDESAGTATFMVTLGESGGQRSASTVTVDFSTANGTATAGSDYTATNGTLTFTAGESVKFVTVNLNNDNTSEGAESFFVNLSNASGASIVDGQAVGTIGLSDGTSVASPRLSVGDLIADETAGFVDVVVTLSAPGTEVVTVDYVTNQNGLPYNGASDYYDFGDVAGTLSFAVGETTKTVRVYIREDAEIENMESFQFQLSNASGAAIYDGRSDITIVDNDNLKTTPQVYVRDVVVDESAGTATFTVLLGESGGQRSASTVTVDFSTANGTATAGSDYTATNGTLSFTAGESVKFVTVNLNNDNTAEGAESFFVNLSNASGASIVDGQAVGTIGLSDGTSLDGPLISVANVTTDETEGYVDVVVTLSAPGTEVVTVDYVTNQNGLPYNGASDYYDFGDVAGTLSFAVGETTKTVRVYIRDDAEIENMESFQFQLSNASGGSIYDGRSDITIVDNDSLKTTPQVYIRDVVVDESAGTATFMVTLGESGGQRSASTVTVDFSTANGTATAGSDYTAANGTLTFTAGESVKFVTVNLNNDNTAEGAESFFVNLANASGASIVDGQAVGTIGLSDGTSSDGPLISVANVTTDETDGYVDVVVTLSAPGTSVVTVDYATSQTGLPYNQADDYYDFGDVAGTLTFAVGETTQSVRVYIREDADVENLESFLFQLSNASGGAIVDGRSDITIVDNDVLKATPQVHVRDVVVDESAGTATFMVTLGESGGQRSASTVTVDFSTANGTAVAGSDYTATAGTLTFMAGESVKFVTVNLNNDANAEAGEKFYVNLANASGASIADGQAVASIGNSDGTTAASPVISITDRIVSERSGYVDFKIELSAPSANVVTVNYADAEVTADNYYDFGNIDGSLRFAAGETTQWLRVYIVDNVSAEQVETFRLNFSGAVNATLGNAFAIGTIVDDDGGFDVLALGDSDDTYVVDSATDVIVENVNGGTDLVQSSINYTLGAQLENLTLTGSAVTGTGNEGANVLLGNGLANTLTGLGGDDTLTGGAGADTLVGGAGNDTYGVDNVGDSVVEALGGGTDVVLSSVTHTLAANVENLVLTGQGAINGTGNDGANTLTGNAAANILSGLAGDDTYIIDSAGDTVVEAPGAGVDTVSVSGVSYTLTANVENLLLNGSANINGTGNVLANSLTGNTGNNTLDGGGGADSMAGGLGDDLYVVDNGGDVVVELPGQGTDRVNASVNATLAAEVENLTLTGAAAINGTGNGLGNSLVGNSAANRLTGLGGNDTLDGAAGADTLTGGTGDDSYVVDNAGDVVTEGAGEGNDSVTASVSHTLAANVENLTLGGNGALSGIGNALANRLTGNSGNNVLNGAAGADTMIGGAGNDSYSVDDAGDVVTEATGEGTDSVTANVSHTLAAHVENLTLTGSGALDGTGNTLANRLTGNNGNNVLDGGAGADTLIGGAGNDRYVVDVAGDVVTELAGQGIDEITTGIDYTLGAELENLSFTGAGARNGVGNGLNNQIRGSSGNDTLDGLAGADSLIGGLGNDTYIVDSVGDTITELAGQGNDTVRSSVSHTLSAEVENLTLTGDQAINGTGNDLANVITGNAAANVLAGGAGADTLTGGAGNDIYVVQGADTLVELVGGGIDEVQSAGNYTLGAEVETLRLTGDANINGAGNTLDNLVYASTGNNGLNGAAGIDTLSYAQAASAVTVSLGLAGAQSTGGSGSDTISNFENLIGSLFNDTLSGSTGDNRLEGSDGNDSLNGDAGNDTLLGGLGNDTMRGGSGDDVYVLQAADTLIEDVGGGIDEVQTKGSVGLAANIENLRLTGTSNTNGSGNSLDNLIYANVGNNSLNGGGGVDTASYALSSAGVTVSLATVGAQVTGGSGTDTLTNFENLGGTGYDDVLGGNGGNNVLDGAGGNDSLTGDAGNDTLIGGGGNDTLTGGTGDDVYVLQGADVIVENASEGTDEVQTSGNSGLGANLENLRLLGTGNINGSGNSADNVITGNTGNNSLNGSGGNDTLVGGAGVDTLIGGSGNDTFVFDSLVGSDTITDFVTGVDRLQISQSGIAVGNGDAVIDGAVTIAGPGGFAASAELVVVTGNIAGAITTASAAAAIGSATSAYAQGQTALFMVDNGSSSSLFLFTAANGDALVSAGELSLLGDLTGTPSVNTGDILFGG